MTRTLFFAALVWSLGCGDDSSTDAGTDASLDAGTDGGTDASADATDAAVDLANVRLITFNDFHGRLEEDSDGLGGMAYLAAHVAELETEQPNSLLVSAGDMVGGSAFLSGALRDEPTIAAFNLIGLDIAGDGNHEHDRPIAELVRLIEGGCDEGDCANGESWDGAEFAFLSANLVDDTGDPMFDGYAIREVDGARIGFIGLTYTSTPMSILPAYREGIAFLPEAETINGIVDELRADGVETIVAVVHQGYRPLGEPCVLPRGPLMPIVDALDDAVDVVVSGHTHHSYICGMDGRVVTSASEYGNQLVVIDLEIDRVTGDVVGSSARFHDVTRDLEPDGAVGALIDEYRELLADPIVGEITESILRERDPAGNSALTALIADAYLAANPDADVAFQNAGGTRSDWLYARAGDETEDGQLRLSELYEAIPFSNELLTMELTGDELTALIEASLADGIVNRNLMPSAGFEIEYDLESDPRVRSLRLRGEALVGDSTYRVTFNSFSVSIYEGVLPSLDEATYLGTDLTYLRSYVEASSPLGPRTDARYIRAE